MSTFDTLLDRSPRPPIAALARLAAPAFMVAIACALPVTPASAADMSKTLHVSQSVAESGFDPQAISDSYSFDICRAIFESLYTYDYFARPVRMIPNTADGMPQISDEGRTYTVKVKPGIYFASDPAFKGKRRELTAEDYVYTIKRIFDPKIRSYWLYVFDHRLLGLDEALALARKTGRFDYNAKIEGLLTLSLTLRCASDPNYIRVRSPTPRTAVRAKSSRAHADAFELCDGDSGSAPVLTAEGGVRGQKIVLSEPDSPADYPAPRR
jgi:ABC-type transport system substrate-binding protein